MAKRCPKDENIFVFSDVEALVIVFQTKIKILILYKSSD